METPDGVAIYNDRGAVLLNLEPDAFARNRFALATAKIHERLAPFAPGDRSRLARPQMELTLDPLA